MTTETDSSEQMIAVVKWSRPDDSELLECHNLSPSQAFHRLQAAIRLNGPITVHALEMDSSERCTCDDQLEGEPRWCLVHPKPVADSSERAKPDVVD